MLKAQIWNQIPDEPRSNLTYLVKEVAFTHTVFVEWYTRSDWSGHMRTRTFVDKGLYNYVSQVAVK